MEGVELVLAGHVDVLAHTAEKPGEAWNSTLNARLKFGHVTLIPTLTLFSHDQDFNTILKEVKTYKDPGGQIMFGTDTGYLTDYPALTKEYGFLARRPYISADSYFTHDNAGCSYGICTSYG